MTTSGKIVTVTLMLLTMSCDNSSTAHASDYDKLCKIFQEELGKQPTVMMAIIQIAKRVPKEIPDVYANFENIANVDPNKVYQLYKTIAEKETKKPWDCKIMKDFYSGKFKDNKITTKTRSSSR